MIATNHLHVLEQNPLKLSFTSRELKVPQNAQTTSSGGELEEPPPERLPGRLPSSDRGCLVRSRAPSHHYNSMPKSHRISYSGRRGEPTFLLANFPFLLGHVSTPPRPMGKYGGELFLVPSEPCSGIPPRKWLRSSSLPFTSAVNR